MSNPSARPALLAVLCTSLVLSACEGSDDRSPFSPQFARQGVANMPFGGSCKTEIHPMGPTTLHITGVCQLRGIGRVNWVAVQTLGLGPVGANFSNVGTYTTPSGATINATFWGIGTQPDANGIVTFEGTETYSGGTGRFANISGSATATGSASLATMTGQFTTNGTITY